MVDYILSFGAGVNSTALLFYLVNHSYPLDKVIFSDTKTELPETYVIIEKIKHYCKNKNIPFIIVGFTDLYQYCEEKELLPSRMFRWCTAKFKVNPIKNYLKTLGETKQYIGFAYDESHRAKKFKDIYPLIDNKITRKGCIKIITEEGFPIPVKSGCYICPFQTKKSWRDLYLKHKELYLKSEKLEDNCMRKDLTFTNQPLKNLKYNFGYNSNKIDDYFVPKCDSGYCFV